MMHVFGPEQEWPRQDLIGFSIEFDAELVLAAYQSGVFPMPLLQGEHDREMGWWSPMRRGVLPIGGLRVTRSLRKMAARYATTVDQAFDEVILRCATSGRVGDWINDQVLEVYRDLHQQGVTHSVEVWDAGGRLVGGLYGVGIAGLFAGESMFHDPEHGRDASKVALMRLVHELRRGVRDAEVDQRRLLDVQWRTDHLASLGVVELPRPEYLARLERVLECAPVRFNREAMVMGRTKDA